MGDFRTVDGFANKIRSYGEAAQKGARVAVEKAAFEMKASIVAEAKSATGGDMLISHLGSKRSIGAGGARLSVVYDIKGTNHPVALVRAVGPWGLVEHGAKAHEILPKLKRITGTGASRARRQRDLSLAFGARGALSGSKPMKVPGSPRGYAYRVRHPGTKGKKPWAKGTARALPLLRSRTPTVFFEAAKAALKG